MKIETKYEIGQEVWFIECKKVVCAKILQITCSIFDDGLIRITYFSECDKEPFFELEENIYPTKEELLKSL